MTTPKYRRLCQTERDTIYRLRKLVKSQAEIAETIGFRPSTVSREIARNMGGRGYRPKQAGQRAAARKMRQRRERKIVGALADEVEGRLHRHHSPVQITGFLNKLGYDAPSHETIYQHIVRDKKAGGDLYTKLRINSKRRYRRRVRAQRGNIVGRVGIEERPPSVETRRYFGDYEVDLVEGAKGTGFILSLVERKSRFTLFRKLADKTKVSVSAAIVDALRAMKVRTLTYDNGLEFAGHLEVSRLLMARSYFCAPYHAWEKGLVENHNGLLRQYYPKGSSFEHITAAGLQDVEDAINERPRKTLEFSCPLDYLKHITAA